VTRIEKESVSNQLYKDLPKFKGQTNMVTQINNLQASRA
jgi:hypothetical protein